MPVIKARSAMVLSPSAPAGTPVVFEGITPNPAPPVILIDEFFSVKMEVREGMVYANGKKVLVDGKPIETDKVEEGEVS